ncbi:MAG: hypothetical protein MAG451_01554 [Anaerolineales bacterium]|nr:hypothetical protein [Anaerolineales bacterium]
MSEGIPEAFVDLLKKKSFAHLSTLMADGTPHVTPVWIDYDGECVLVNSSKGRQKDINMEARAQVALSIQDPDDAYRYLAIRGPIVEITEDGADEHIDKLAQRYLGEEKYPFRGPGEVRRIYRIVPEHVMTNG